MQSTEGREAFRSPAADQILHVGNSGEWDLRDKNCGWLTGRLASHSICHHYSKAATVRLVA
ncbi:MAG: hypothetical protein ACRD1O_09670, partial [Terriglobia bacterium]